jgi:hypothetical protein
MNWSLDSAQQADSVIENITALFQKQIKERCGHPLPVFSETSVPPANRRLVFRVDPSIMGAESFTIENGANDSLWVVGHDPRGLLYGVGKLLHTSSYSPGTFKPGSWRGYSHPALPLRGIYFATHFHNWYHVAPVDEVERYIEEMALWGTNTLSIWFDQHHYQGIDDPQAQAMLERLKIILSAARRIGLNTSATLLANEGYASSPAELRADWHVSPNLPGQNGYHHEPVGHYHVEICPSKPGGMELVLRCTAEKLQAFQEVGLDYLWIWPYDQGGCTCRECAPWGINGFLRLAEPIARMYREHFPEGKVILSTWYFDHFIDGEWEGLARAFQNKPDWVDFLLADDAADIFPPYPLKNGVPGGFPLVNFPEISMYCCNPWGGYGSNPFPAHLQALWDQSKVLLSGGFPYSEGIYEDINKAICAQFYWDPAKPAAETVKEYIAYEYSPEVVDKVSTAIDILEYNLPRGIQKTDPAVFAVQGYRFPMQHSREVEHCWQLVQEADGSLPPARRASWRWRVLYLRALIDRELAANNGFTTPRSEAAFEELTQLYHAENTSLWVSPPTRDALAAKREANYLDV